MGEEPPRGSHEILAHYGVNEPAMGADNPLVLMETVFLGKTPEGFPLFMDWMLWESDGVVVVNRIKPHTDFSGKIESGVLKMFTIGMAKLQGATEGHRLTWKYGYEKTIRGVSAGVLATGKILCGVALVENELHRASPPRASWCNSFSTSATPQSILPVASTPAETLRMVFS